MKKSYVKLKTEYGIIGINLGNVLEFEIESLENGGNIIKVYYSNNYEKIYCDNVAFENEFKRINEAEESTLFSKEVSISNLRSRHLLNFNEVKGNLIALFY